MPSFDVVSEVDRQELRNAIDQAQRELANRYDFKDTNSEIEQKDLILTLRTSNEDRLRALKVLLEERFVKRNISLKSLDWGKIEQATGESYQTRKEQIKGKVVSLEVEQANKLAELEAAKATELKELLQSRRADLKAFEMTYTNDKSKIEKANRRFTMTMHSNDPTKLIVFRFI